jgi:hypothetical protein
VERKCVVVCERRKSCRRNLGKLPSLLSCYMQAMKLDMVMAAMAAPPFSTSGGFVSVASASSSSSSGSPLSRAQKRVLWAEKKTRSGAKFCRGGRTSPRRASCTAQILSAGKMDSSFV